MPTLLTPAALKAFFDANPKRYKSPMAGGVVPQADGYLPSRWLDYQLCTPEGNFKSKPNRVRVQPQVFKRFSLADLFGSRGIGSDSGKKVLASEPPTRILDAISSQDREFLSQWATLHQLAGNITSAELAAVQTILQATIPDPNWTASIPACDLEACFVDGMGKGPLRLELARNADGSHMIHSGIAYINAALDRG